MSRRINLIDQRGMSLLELLVTVVMMIIITAAIYATVTFQTKSRYRESGIIQIQEVGQQIITLLKRDIMMAGYGVESKKMAFFFQDGGNEAPDRIYINDWTFISENELLNGTYGDTSFTAPLSSLKNVQHDLDGDGEDEIRDCHACNGSQRVITDYTGSSPELKKVARIACSGTDNYALKRGDGTDSSTSIYGSYVAPAIYYEINYQSSSKTYSLRRSDRTLSNIQVLAPNVVDLQVAYCEDSNGDGDCDTWYCSGGTTSCPMDPFDPEKIVLVRISIVMRTKRKVKGFLTSSGRPALENRAGGSNDKYVYRVYTATVAPRNVVLTR